MSGLVIQHQSEQRSLSPMRSSELRQQVGVIKDVLDHVMQKNVHYGIIPGCKEPSLYKPGAEKIMATFRLSADPEITDLSDGDQIRYQVKVRLVSPSGHFVGAGIGECSSSEEKYKWRNAVCNEEFDETPSDRKREKWTRGYQGKPNYKKKQIRTEPADMANTILKMAKKRALIDAVLTATAASDCFTQDIEDLPPEYLDEAQPQQGGFAAPVESVSEQQVADLKQAVLAAGTTIEAFCAKAKVGSIEQLPAQRFAGAMKFLQQQAQGAQQ